MSKTYSYRELMNKFVPKLQDNQLHFLKQAKYKEIYITTIEDYEACMDLVYRGYLSQSFQYEHIFDSGRYFVITGEGIQKLKEIEKGE